MSLSEYIPRAHKRTLFLLMLIFVGALIGLLLAPSGPITLSTALGRDELASKAPRDANWRSARRSDSMGDVLGAEDGEEVDTSKYLSDLQMAKGQLAEEDASGDGIASEDSSTFNGSSTGKSQDAATDNLSLDITLDNEQVHVGNVRGRRLYMNILKAVGILDREFMELCHGNMCGYADDIFPKVYYQGEKNVMKGIVQIYVMWTDFHGGPEARNAGEIVARVYEAASRAVDNTYDLDIEGSRRTILARVPMRVQVQYPVLDGGVGTLSVELRQLDFDDKKGDSFLEYKASNAGLAIQAVQLNDWAGTVEDHSGHKHGSIAKTVYSGNKDCFWSGWQDRHDISKCSKEIIIQTKGGGSGSGDSMLADDAPAASNGERPRAAMRDTSAISHQRG